MKKLCLVALVAIFSLTTVKAQEGFNVGAHIGLPVGDASDAAGLNFGADISYLFEVADNFYAGIASGYSHFTGKSQTINAGPLSITTSGTSFGFIPIAATGRYNFSDQIFGGADLGYGISTQSGGSGGFYYQPKVGWTSEALDVFAFYKGIDSFGSVGVGATFRFGS